MKVHNAFWVWVRYASRVFIIVSVQVGGAVSDAPGSGNPIHIS